jgi:hypothetical protein
MADQSTGDFRSAAAEQSARLAPDASGNLYDAGPSFCRRMEGDASVAFYKIALIPWVFLGAGLALLLAGLVLIVLILTPLLDARLWSIGGAVAAIVAGLVLVLMSPGASDGVFEGALEGRLGPRLAALKSRVPDVYRFAVEDPATYQSQKVASEDYAYGGVDASRPGLLLEGLRYRYVVRPKDVTELREDGDYLLITYAVGGARVTVAMNVLSGDKELERKVRESIRQALISPANRP